MFPSAGYNSSTTPTDAPAETTCRYKPLPLLLSRYIVTVLPCFVTPMWLYYERLHMLLGQGENATLYNSGTDIRVLDTEILSTWRLLRAPIGPVNPLLWARDRLHRFPLKSLLILPLFLIQ